MADKKLKRPADRRRINMSAKEDRAYWSKKYGVTGVSLAAAVRQAGNTTDAVGQFFKDKRKAVAKKAKAAAKTVAKTARKAIKSAKRMTGMTTPAKKKPSKKKTSKKTLSKKTTSKKTASKKTTKTSAKAKSRR